MKISDATQAVMFSNITFSFPSSLCPTSIYQLKRTVDSTKLVDFFGFGLCCILCICIYNNDLILRDCSAKFLNITSLHKPK